MIDSLPYKVVWVASMPRTGSMWAYNVVRELVRAAGRAVEPERVPVDELAMLARF